MVNDLPEPDKEKKISWLHIRHYFDKIQDGKVVDIYDLANHFHLSPDDEDFKAALEVHVKNRSLEKIIYQKDNKAGVGYRKYVLDTSKETNPRYKKD